MSTLFADVAALRASVARFQESVSALPDAALSEPSLLPGWSRGHVLTHVARSADSRRRLLEAARHGEVGRQYADEEHRAREIEEGARRLPGQIRRDAVESLDRLLTVVTEQPADRWDTPGVWLGVGPRPVRRVVPSMRREVEYHHVDLAAEYGPDDWPADFVEAQLDRVTASFGERADAGAFTVRLPGRDLRVGDGGDLVVAGEPAPMLAWLTGRGDGSGLRTSPPGPLPALPPLS
ncbi:maleylpyruvate isomerase family mycothiol-dependent enzyme [Actinoplanes oblitus]|uniref:Maleylpyruvate isomerase family mycothiol-dependent enzyme n=1 Tax=Actinoplanes oblitus TaxID=3040509 RepID=A0ABY8WBL3_9ACTN|nr:maleylpyruvate isomerase family mycothiol-dependent enzyme [Actinoplanes oblitus]WIM94516.1 maleylpyruvate isomerase family mycothiol-dependent enzyme [Actinoplanes oblitus]